MSSIQITPAALLGTNDFNAQQRGVAGSEGVPSWSFTTATGAGMFLSGTALGLSVGGAERWQISSAGHLLAVDTATYDIGASGATSPRDIYLTRNLTLGGVINLPDGTAGAPSLTNTGDTNTGIYFPSDEQVGISVTGAGRVVFSASLIFPITDAQISLGTGSFRFVDLNLSGAANIGGALNHDGTTIGFYSATPIVQPTWTLTGATLIDQSGGTSGENTISNVVAASVDTSAASLTSTRNAIATLADATNENTADIAALKAILSEAASGNGIVA